MQLDSRTNNSSLVLAFEPAPGAIREANAVGLHTLDHLTHNVNRGRMDHWAQFYERVFNFRQIRYFDIEGQQTGLLSRAMTAPDDKIRIPLNESRDDYSQIAEYLKEYKGEGIQHLAMATEDIFATAESLKVNGMSNASSTSHVGTEIASQSVNDQKETSSISRQSFRIERAPESFSRILRRMRWMRLGMKVPSVTRATHRITRCEIF